MTFSGIAIGVGLVALASALAWAFAPKGWRTFAFNGFAIGLESAPYLLDQLGVVDWSSLLGEHNGPFVAAAIGLCNVALRMVTTTPPMRSK